MGKGDFIKTTIWLGFISLNTIIFKAWCQISIMPLAAAVFHLPYLVDPPTSEFLSTAFGVFWSVFIYMAWYLKFRKGGDEA